MENNFTDAERTFVEQGGNLWYVRPVPGDGWEVVRWSNRGRRSIGLPAASPDQARDQLFDYVKPSSERARTTVRHDIARTCRQHRDFPVLC